MCAQLPLLAQIEMRMSVAVVVVVVAVVGDVVVAVDVVVVVDWLVRPIRRTQGRKRADGKYGHARFRVFHLLRFTVFAQERLVWKKRK